ncbi:MAG: aromatic ring-hydroxylating dioxygenase subunit alpha [Thermoanaerobaculia bacterium]
MEYLGHALSDKATTLPGEYYTSEAIFAAEEERIFARRWLCAGRSDAVAEPGDYRLFDVGRESLILVRGRDGAARAFFNVCRHRGTRLCEEPAGRFAGAIQCPYHAWTYGLDGVLLSAPHMADVPWFAKADYPLVSASVAEWEGFLFVNLAREARSLDEALHPLLGRFAPWRLPTLKTARSIDYDVAANWKLIYQNYSECYHCPPVHPALAKLSHYRSGANNLRDGAVLGGYMTITQKGGSLTTSGRMCGVPLGEISEEERQRVYYYSVFPGLFLTIQPDFAMATRLTPVSVGRTRVVCDFLFAPESLAEPGFDPVDGIDIWDVTNRQDWHVCELAQRGVSSRAYHPGLYAREESLLAAFDREYLRSLSGA